MLHEKKRSFGFLLKPLCHLLKSAFSTMTFVFPKMRGLGHLTNLPLVKAFLFSLTVLLWVRSLCVRLCRWICRQLYGRLCGRSCNPCLLPCIRVQPWLCSRFNCGAPLAREGSHKDTRRVDDRWGRWPINSSRGWIENEALSAGARRTGSLTQGV